MKRIIFTAVGLLVFSALTAAVLTVDNAPGAGAQYATLSSAHNAASPGDTLLIHASPNSYGDFEVSKRLMLIGPGYFDHDALSANINIISLRNGATGTVITGLKISRINVEVWHKVDSITIARNFISTHGNGITGGYGSNFGSVGESDDWLIEGNVLIEQSGCGGCEFIDVKNSGNGNDNWLFRNNFIQSKTDQHNTSLLSYLNATTYFYNNIIVHLHNGDPFENSEGAHFQNNVIFTYNGSWAKFDSTCTNCTFDYNLLYNPNTTASPLNGSNNLIDVDPQFLEVGNPNYPLWSFDHDYHFEAGAPANTAASNGGPLGIYGPDYPFHMHGFPSGLPHVDDLILENVIIQQGSDLNFQLKATGGVK